MPSFVEVTSPALMQSSYCCGVICGAVAVAWIAMTIWVFRDAEERDMSSGLWGIGTLILGPIVLLVYLLVRRERPFKYYVPMDYRPEVAPLPQTHQMQPPVRFTPKQPSYCTKCGRRLDPKTLKCLSCDG